MVDRVIVNKAARELLLVSGEAVVRIYRVALGRNPVGHKQQQGDGRTPEGAYTICGRNPKSRFHLSLRISYPNNADRARAYPEDPGGDIMIHGLRNGDAACPHPEDWTEGCVAVTNAEMDEIWRLVPDGTAVQINP
jgi:murein L,D-transpeptidase YafK